jgi:hypothetical protein
LLLLLLLVVEIHDGSALELTRKWKAFKGGREPVGGANARTGMDPVGGRMLSGNWHIQGGIQVCQIRGIFGMVMRHRGGVGIANNWRWRWRQIRHNLINPSNEEKNLLK